VAIFLVMKKGHRILVKENLRRHFITCKRVRILLLIKLQL